MNRYIRAAAFVALAALQGASLSGTCSAGSIDHPAGLNPGDTYRLVFITAEKRDATSADIEDYNDFVTSEAAAAGSLVAGLNTDWKAIVSTPTVDAIDNTGSDPSPAGVTGVPIYLVDGIKRVAANYDDLWNGTIENTIHQSQILGAPAEAVWTGTGFDGAKSQPLGTADPAYGLITTTGAGWAFWGDTIPPGTALPVYAMSGVLTVLPEPGTAALLGLGILGTVVPLRGRAV